MIEMHIFAGTGDRCYICGETSVWVNVSLLQVQEDKNHQTREVILCKYCLIDILVEKKLI